MTWQQPQLANPLMGPTDEIKKLQHRLIYAFPANSHAHDYGVIESGLFDQATDKALRDIQHFLDGKFVAALGKTFVNTQPGVLTYDTKLALGVVVLPPKAPTKRFVQQGVGYDTSAFLMGNVNHSYNMAVAECIAEMNRLALPLFGVPKVVIGYSMGDDAQNQWLMQWPADRRDEIKLVVGFGSPSRPPGPTKLGNNPQGQGISGIFTPDWCLDRTYLFINDGDMYPEAVGLLPWFYQILTRMALTLDFASYLFGMLTSTVGGQLLGTIGSTVPFAGILAPIAGLVTAGPVTKTSGPILNPLSLLAMLPEVLQTLAALMKFLTTQAHYHYHDQPRPYWRGLTAVDCAAQIIAEKVDTAVVYTVPGTVSWWNDGPPAWTAWKLP